MATDFWNLMRAYEAYLIFAFLGTAAIRLRHQYLTARLVLSFPQRWPHLYAVARRHGVVLFNVPTAVAVGAALGLIAIHSLASRYWWPEASVEMSLVREHPVLLVWLVLIATAMLTVDVRSILTAPRRDPRRSERWFVLTELLLASGLGGAIGPLVDWRVRRTLVQAGLLLNRWVWRWSLQLTVRLLVGLTLWATWLRYA